MYDDDYRVTSVPYRLMPPRKRARSGNPGEALDAVSGTEPATAGSSAVFRPASRQRQWPWHAGRFLVRVDVWILIATVTGVVIAYLTLVKH